MVTGDGVEAKVLTIVAEQTGYPEDLLDMDLDLEADLGVDTVKQAETFAAVREAYGIERQESLKLRDFPTLRSVVGFVYQFRPELRPAAEAGGDGLAAGQRQFQGRRRQRQTPARWSGPPDTSPRRARETPPEGNRRCRAAW